MINEKMSISTPFNHSIVDNNSSINTNLNPNLSQVSFRVKFETTYGQSVYIIGNIEELGSWDPSKALLLITNKEKYPIWKSTTDIVCPVGMEIYYKYLVKEGNNYHWETCQNRHIVITSPGKFIISDEKGILYSQIKSINNNIIPSLMVTPNNTLYNNNLNTNTYTTTNIYNPSSYTISSIKQEGISMDLMSFSKIDDDVVGKENLQDLISYENNIFDNHYLVEDKNIHFDFLNSDNLKGEDRIIIASSYLPFIIEKIDNNFKIKIVDDKFVYLVLYNLKEKNLCDVIWVGMLRNIDDFTEIEIYQIIDFLQEQNIYLVNVDKKISNNFWIYINEIISPIFSKSQVEIENPFFLEHEKYFDDYLRVNKEYGDIIHNITSKNDLIMVNDIDLAMVPNFLIGKRNLNTKIGFYFHCPIPSSEVLNVLPGHMEILKSLLLCDVIGFHVFKYAKNFLNSINREFGINFSVEKKGNIIINDLGRDILIHILNAGFDIEYLNIIKNCKPVSLIKESYLPIIKDKLIISSIDNLRSPKQIYIKLEAYKLFLEKNPNQKGKIVLIQILVNNRDYNDNFSFIQSKINEITSLYGEDSIYIKYVKTFSVYEQVALFSITNILFFLQIEMYNGLLTLEREFISLQNENKIFGLVINENIGVSSILKSYTKVNSFNQNEIAKVIDNIINTSLEDRKKNLNHDMEYIKSKSTFSWIREFLINLKRMTLNDTSIKIPMGIGMNLRIMKLNSSFIHLELNKLSNAYKKTKERVFFFDYSTLKNIDNEEFKISKEKTYTFLNDLINNKNNHLYIISNLKKEELNDIENNIKEIGIGAESGYYYKSPNNNYYETLMEIRDWNWKEKVIKLFSSFIEKTEGSKIIEKDSSIIWNYKNCDTYFGHLQANELLCHLNNIFEGKKLDIINGNDYVEVKPKNLNKGFFISQILKKEFLQERNIDMIFTLGDDIDCEDMFKYLNSIEIQFNKIGKKVELFGVTIGRKPSSARYYLNEVNELFTYFDSLEH